MKPSAKNPFMSKIMLIGMAVFFLFAFAWTQEDELYQDGYLLPSEMVQDFLNRDGHQDSLNNLSPDGDHFLIPISEYFSSLKLMTQRTLRLAMLEICPDVNRTWTRSTYGNVGLKIYSLEQKESWMIDVPDNAFVSDMVWSPDGKKIAFLAHLPEGTQVWTADVKTGKAEALNKSYVMATLAGGGGGFGRGARAPSNMLFWTPSGSIITLLVPLNRGPEPKENPVPPSPVIRHTRKSAVTTPTYPFLLRTEHDKDLLEYFTTSQLAELSPGKKPRLIGEPAMYTSVSPNPDRQYFLVEKMTRPFSFIVSYSSFPRETQVIDQEGNILSTLVKTPLREGRSRGGGNGDTPRDIFWRPDGKGLSLLMQEPRERGQDNNQGEQEEEQEQAPRMDRLMLLTPPFDLEKAQVLVVSKQRIGNISYSQNGRFAFTQLSGEDENCETGTHIVAFDLNAAPPQKIFLLKKIETQNPVKLPGSIMVRINEKGLPYALTSDDDRHIYLQSQGYQEDYKPRPFIDSIEIQTGQKERVFEGSSDMYERPVVPLDRNLGRMIISRESTSVLPDSWLWVRNGDLTNLTNNKNPYPEFEGCTREYFEFTRRDGLEIRGRISLPAGYKPGTRLPGVFWTYPREYASNRDYKTATIRSVNLNSYRSFSYRNASDIWLSQGYALVEPDIPIIGADYNNNFVAHLVDSMYAAIRKVDEMGYVDIDKLGHGGHSYGAFTTANILSHSPFFKAGIAGDGAYNRTLTPMGFQSERRNIWEAQDVYLEMSPFFQADHMDTPLLMYHGAADNNTGTFIIQSERYMQLLTGLGKNAVLYIYPFESHGPRCKETYMDMWSRWLKFFDRYLKGESENTEK